jgi:hypothetical protein
MGVGDLPVWGRIAAELADLGLDRLGAKRCARKGHKWRDVGAIVLRQDGSVEERARGAAQRCRRCGAVRHQDQEEPTA